MLRFHDRDYPPNSPIPENLFQTRYEFAGQALAPVVRMNRQSVDVPAPPIKRSDDRSHDLPVDLSHKEGSGITLEKGSNIFKAIRHAWDSVGLLPEFKDGGYFALLESSNVHF